MRRRGSATRGLARQHDCLMKPKWASAASQEAADSVHHLLHPCSASMLLLCALLWLLFALLCYCTTLGVKSCSLGARFHAALFPFKIENDNCQPRFWRKTMCRCTTYIILKCGQLVPLVLPTSLNTCKPFAILRRPARSRGHMLCNYMGYIAPLLMSSHSGSKQELCP